MKDFITKSTFNHTDKYGVVRSITIAVVVSGIKASLDNYDSGDYFLDINRRIGVGISIQNPLDDLNLEIGSKIAVGRAKKDTAATAVYYTDTSDIVPNEIIAGILNYYQSDFIRNTNKYFKISDGTATKIAKELGKL